MALRAGPKPDLSGALIPAGLTGTEFAEQFHGAPLTWQAPILDAYTADERPRVAYVQVPRKNGKSWLGAAVAINEMVMRGGQVFLISDSERNLKSALFFELCSIVRNSPRLTAMVHTYKDHLECPASGGGIYLRPNNLSASQSINPDLVIFDEVHMQKSDEIWNGMILAGDAAERGMVLGITTPGYDVTGMAHGLYEQVKAGVLDGVIHEGTNAKVDLAHEGAVVEQLKIANPVLEDRPEMMDRFLAQIGLRPGAGRISDHDFLRFRLGLWTTGGSAWLPYGAWAARRSPNAFEWTEGTWVGFDGSHSGDSSALVAVNPGGQLTVLGLWERPSRLTGKAAENWRVPRADVDRAVSAAMDRDVRPCLVADPPYWRTEIQEWETRWPGRVFEFPTSSTARMAPACTTFYSAVMEGRIQDCTPDGRFQTAMAEHLANATVKETPNGTVIVKSSQWSPRKIDLAVAAVIAANNALVPAPEEFEIIVL
jgi:phage terminase large subunit-like protein